MKTWLLAAILLAPLAGLAQKVDIQKDDEVDFAAFTTFHITNGTITAKAPALNNDLVRKNLETSIRKYLTARGLTEVASNQDLNVRFHLGAGPRAEVTAVPAGRLGLGTRRVRQRFTEGTLTIDLLQHEDRALLWRAIAVDDENNPAKVQSHLDDMVRKAFDKYPRRK